MNLRSTIHLKRETPCLKHLNV